MNLENDRTLVSSFVEQVAQNGARPAVSCGSEALSYVELDRRARDLSSVLREFGVGQDVAVAVCMSRSVDLIVALLGILYVGGAYVPLDSSYPQERLEFMFADCGAKVLLTKNGGIDLPAKHTVLLDEPLSAVAELEVLLPSLEDLAYIIYTSGSTGKPKGVLCHHRGAVNMLSDGQKHRKLGPGDRCSWWTSLSFDVSVYEIFSALTSGAELVVVPEDVRANGAMFCYWLFDKKITSAYLPPMLVSELETWVMRNPGKSRLRRLLTGVEPIPEGRLINIARAVPELHIMNGYGPTEAAVYCTVYHVDPESGDPSRITPIGKPLNGVEISLLDDQRQPVADGREGEIYIGGVQVERGYLNCRRLTALVFEDGRYRTGDRAVRLPDGNLMFRGRTDHQVKFRGYRIELGEISSTLCLTDGVNEAVVVVREDTPGNQRLVAYFTASGTDTPDSDFLRKQLHKSLPSYIVPSLFIHLPYLPETSNGKVDRDALPVPSESDLEDLHAEEFRPPVSSAEHKVAEVFELLLNVPRTGLDDDFFLLGGHSLLATQALSRLEAGVSLHDLYEHSTVGELAALIETAEKTAPIPVAPEMETYPLTASQQTMWMMHHSDRSGALSNIPVVLHLTGPLDTAVMEQSLNEVIRRHDALRMIFSLKDGEPVQRPLDEVHLDVPVIDLSAFDADERERRRLEIKRECGLHRFDLSTGPLLYAKLVRLAENRFDLYFTIHHIASDGWGLTVLTRDFIRIYEAFLYQKSSPLPPPVRQYRDVAVWMKERESDEAMQTQLDYWKQKLAAPRPDIHFALDHDRPEASAHKASRFAFNILPELTADLKSLGQRAHASLYMVLTSIWQILLHRASGSNDIITGAAIAGRNHVEMEQVVGTFINALALRTDFSGAVSFLDVLARVRRVALDAYAHQEVPFARVMEAVSDGTGHPIFRNSLILHNMPHPPRSFGGLTMTNDEMGNDTSKMDALLYFIERPGQLEGQLEYDTEIFSAQGVEKLVDDFMALAHWIVQSASLPLDEFVPGNEQAVPSCFVIGEGSLCLRCIDVLRRSGMRVLGLISPDADNRRWAREKGIPWHHPNEGFETVLSSRPFDFLFSIVNSYIIKPNVLALPRRAAINYHDSPLPRYAGVHSTAWAIINRETQHGVTWHLMADEVDAGDILAQKKVPIREDDTSFTLNARCYDAAVEALNELASELMEGRERRISQDLSKRTYCSLYQRPANGCLIDWSATQEETDSLRRALDFGTHPNELGLPKVLFGGELYVLRPDGKLLTMAGEDSDLVFPAVGESSEWIVNEPEFSSFGETVEAVNAEVACHEPFWVRQYENFQSLEIPEAMDGLLMARSLETPAFFLCFLARFFLQESFSVGWKSGVEPGEFFERVVPLNFTVDLEGSLCDALTAASGAIEQCRRRKTVGRDVFLRYPTLGKRPDYSVILSNDEVQCSADVWNHFCAFRKSARESFPLFMQAVLTDQELVALEKFRSCTPALSEADCIHHLFEEQAAKTPEAVAVESADGSLTYAELNLQAGLLASHLKAHDPDPDTPIGLFVNRSLEMCIGILGILKTGCAYVPLDPDYPADRLEFIISDTSMPLIVSVSKLSSQIAGHGCNVLNMDRLKDYSEILPTQPVSSGSLAYVFYTSGSTGKPKGVMVEHGNVVNHCLSSVKTYGISAKDRVLQFFSMNFDGSVEELFPAWACGATVVLRTDELSGSVSEFEAFVDERRISVVDLPTAYWHEWVRHVRTVPQSLRAVIIGGEKVSAELCRVWVQKTEGRVRLFNTYGPTECTVVSSVYEVSGVIGGEVPIGQPIAGTALYVADRYLQPVPIGMPGELLIGGAGVARGYLNRPGMTAEKFIENSWGEGRVYRTGDLVCRRKDGGLDFLGRVDNQVKIRGFRIEPDEIAAVLEQHSDVTQAIVIARTDMSEQKELAAYCIFEPGSSPGMKELREFLSQRLPEYMVPSAFVEVDEFPAAPGGKVDRKALPLPVKTQVRERENYVPPASPLQKILAEIWSAVLGMDEIGIHDNFFDLGGHSLLAIQLVERISATGSTLSVAELFQYPTIEEMAAIIGERSIGGEEGLECLVCLKKGKKGRVPFFLLHSAPGDLLGYSNLVHHLSSDQPVYGFQSLGLVDPNHVHSTIPEMAAHYITVLNGFMPDGPVMLGGWCYGGYVAMEMARQLTEQGRDVKLLALIDAWAYLPAERKFSFYHRRFQLMRIIGVREWIQIMKQKVNRLVSDETEDARKMLDGVKVSCCQLANREAVYCRNRQAALKYKSRYYPGTVTLFRSDVIASWFLPDMTMEWASLTDDQDVYLIPGGHRDMLREPAVKTLAASLFESIENALG